MAESFSLKLEVVLGNGMDNMLNIKEVVADAVPYGLKAVGDFVLEQSNLRVPVDRGWLRDSGEVVVDGAGYDAQVAISYGNDVVDYAVVVHERLDVRHNVGEAKFLENAFLNSLSQLQTIFNTEIENRIT